MKDTLNFQQNLLFDGDYIMNTEMPFASNNEAKNGQVNNIQDDFRFEIEQYLLSPPDNQIMNSSQNQQSVDGQNINGENIQQNLLPNDELTDRSVNTNNEYKNDNEKQTESPDNSTVGIMMEIDREIEDFILQEYNNQFDSKPNSNQASSISSQESYSIDSEQSFLPDESNQIINRVESINSQESIPNNGSPEIIDLTLDDSSDQVKCNDEDKKKNEEAYLSQLIDFLYNENQTYKNNQFTKCNICNKYFQSSLLLSIHKEIAHNRGKETKQGDVAEIDSVYKDLEDQRLNVNNDDDNESSIKQQYMDLKQHFAILLKEKGSSLYKCSTCSLNFETLEEYKRHKKSQKHERRFKCNVCEKAFTQQNALKEHCRIHTKERPFMCDICQKGFTQAHALKEHRRIHTGEKPYECILCKMSFRVRSQLTNHKCKKRSLLINSICSIDK